MSPRQIRLLAICGVLAVVAILGFALSFFIHARPANVVEASGTIEVTQSDIAPKVQGRLLSLRVNDGDAVRKGQIVAVLEDVDPTFAVQQASANVTAAAEQVAVTGSRLGQAGQNLDIETAGVSLGIDQAEAQLLSARSAYHLAATDLSRARSLVESGDEPRQMLDDASSTYVSAGAQLKSAQDAVALAETNRRNVAVRALDVRASDLQRLQAGADLAQARAALALAQDQVHETRLIAPYDGYVISHNFEGGDLVQPGGAVMTVGDLEHPYVYLYVSETDLPHIKTGMHADISVDGMPGRIFIGTVTEISTTAEFTPENVQTKEERIEYLVFRIKVQFIDRTGTLKPGLPVDAVIHV